MGEGGLKPPWATLAIAGFLALMTLVAQASHLPYVLFPELGALGWVIFRDHHHPWARSPALLMLTPFLSAMPGVWLSRHMGYEPIAVLLDVGISLLVIGALRSPITPALSAGLLPLALGIHSWAYPFSILIGTGALALVIGLRCHPSWRWTAREHVDGPFAPERAPGAGSALPPIRGWILAFAVFLLGGLALGTVIGSPLVLFPPLLVIAFETLVHGQHCPWCFTPIRVWVVGNAAAILGLTVVLQLGVTPLATLLAVLLCLALLRLTRLNFPPALGLALLPFVIPHPPLSYPLFTMAGSLWLAIVAWILRPRGHPAAGGPIAGAPNGAAPASHPATSNPRASRQNRSDH